MYRELRQNKISLLYTQRLRHLLKEVYRTFHCNGPCYLRNSFSLKETKYNMRDLISVNVSKVKTTKYGLNSHVYYSTKLWNCLSKEVKCAQSLKEFKLLIHEWNGIVFVPIATNVF